MTPFRQQIFDKYEGRCAYCGCELRQRFQVDHLVPKHNFGLRWGQGRLPLFLKHLSIGDMNHIDNLMPSCQSCNNYKGAYDLETFRHELGQLVFRLQKTISIYKIAKRFGHIVETGIPIKFYFETLKEEK